MSYRKERSCEECACPYMARARTQRICDRCRVVPCANATCDITFSRRDLSQRYCSSRCAALSTAPRGRDHRNYNGGLTFHRRQRRWYIVCRDGTAMPYYRGVMAAQLGRLLRSDELVHHVNEDSTDDRPENLELTTRADHFYAHLLRKAQRLAAAA